MIVAVRRIAIILTVVCVLLALSLVGGVANYTAQITLRDNMVTSQESTISNLTAQIAENNNTISLLSSQLENATSQIAALAEEKDQLVDNTTNLNAKIVSLENQFDTTNEQLNSSASNIAELQNQISFQQSVMNLSISRLNTLVFHASEKGTGYSWGHLPNVTYTYNQLLDLNRGRYSILLLPEYKGHQNWAEELSWITANFGGKGGIPIMLNVFGGGNTNTPTPMLSISDIQAAMSVANVKQLRISEVLSWHIEHPATPFPTAYLNSLFEFCRTNNLKIFWTEWKIDQLPDCAIFKAIQNYTRGFEDIVTVSFSTNSEYIEPLDGFLLMNNMFQHWGGSVQSWYWQTRYSVDLLNMPISTLTQHALLAKNMGAEIIQFEPYWYFFDNGTPNDNLKLLMGML